MPWAGGLEGKAMGNVAFKPTMSAQDFLAWDQTQTIRHEFVDGELFSMAGAEDRHVTVTGNFYMALRQHLAGTPCRVLMVDTKVHVAAANSYFNPDVLVTCDSADHSNRLVKSNPKLLVEVLSPSTAAYDRGDKFAHYRRIDALQEYAVVDIDSRRTDIFRKGADGLWVLHPFEAGAAIHLTSVALDISAEQLFAEVDPPASA
jgi:Uma2 family endonuclease